MKKMMRFATFTLLLSVVSHYTFGQDISGIWRGYFITESGEQYKYEVQLGQSKKNILAGVTYSYLDTRFYGKATFTGNYTKASNVALVQEIKTVELKMSGGSVACIMKCRVEYSRSGNEEFLEGSYVSSYEKADLFNGIKRGGNCGGGKVFLRKVPTSDFYVEPFLRNKKTITSPPQNETVKADRPKTSLKKPIPKPPVIKNTTRKNSTVKKPVIKKPVIVEPEKRTPVDEVVVTPKVVEKKILTPPAIIRERKNELTKTITVNSQTVTISLYDNGEIDDDTISVYLDGRLILANKRLSHTPITYQLEMSESSPDHTLVMVAENMGRIPPNTSLMIIQDGDKRYQASITSTEQKNAMVRFRYEKKE
ncbi:MAG: hypothetical protein M3Y85_01115 [Bacteroidota bacterium]|nr:hypothetical protein [Bacteroidota bacterium]